VWGLFAKLSYAAAHRIVVLSPGMREALIAQGVPREKVSVVPTWADQDEVRPVPREENLFRREHGLGEDFVVMYSGNLGTCHLYREFADAARRLQHRHDIRFLFVGGGKRSDLLRAEIGELPNVRFLPYQERTMLAESLSAADVHLVSLDPCYEGLLAPSKLYGIMAAGRPVLYVGGDRGDIPQVLRASECGAVVPPGRGDLLAEAIVRMAASPAERLEMGARARAGFLAQYDRRVVVPRMIRLLLAAARETLPEDDSMQPLAAPDSGAR
jgi:glycosyltransferase involved in cell wall biosynthesis